MTTPGDRPIRTVRLIARLNIGGPARHTTLLDAGLRRRGYETLLVYGTPGEGEGSLEHLVADHGLSAVRLPTLGRRIRPWDDLRTFAAVLRILRQARPHVLHTHTAKAGALGRLAATVHNLGRPVRERCAVVHTFHGHVLEGYFSPVGNCAVRWAERLLATLTDRIVAISEGQRRDLVERFRIAPARKVSVVPLGLDLSAMLSVGPSKEGRQALGLGRDDFVTTFVGRFVPIKNVPLLLEAFALLARRLPAARLLLVGEGPLRAALEEEVRARDLAHAVRFLGWKEQLAGIYASSDVVVLTSWNEGTPVALIEAMAAGVAVVTTDVGGVADLVQDGRTGCLVRAGDAPQLADVLHRMATDVPLRAALGRAAREAVRSRYAAERLVDDIDRLYRLLLADRRPAE